MSDGIAYSSNHSDVTSAWDAFVAHREEVRLKREALSARYDGRGVMVNRIGFGHGTRVVGLEQRADDVDGTIIGDNGELRVPKVGPPYRTIVPNTRRKAGKDLAAELHTMRLEGPSLPGMPDFQLVGLRSLAPALFVHGGTVWARWAEDITDVKTGGTVDLDRWAVQPLSAYYAAREVFEAATGDAA